MKSKVSLLLWSALISSVMTFCIHTVYFMKMEYNRNKRNKIVTSINNRCHVPMMKKYYNEGLQNFFVHGVNSFQRFKELCNEKSIHGIEFDLILSNNRAYMSHDPVPDATTYPTFTDILKVISKSIGKSFWVDFKSYYDDNGTLRGSCNLADRKLLLDILSSMSPKINPNILYIEGHCIDALYKEARERGNDIFRPILDIWHMHCGSDKQSINLLNKIDKSEVCNISLSGNLDGQCYDVNLNYFHFYKPYSVTLISDTPDKQSYWKN